MQDPQTSDGIGQDPELASGITALTQEEAAKHVQTWRVDWREAGARRASTCRDTLMSRYPLTRLRAVRQREGNRENLMHAFMRLGRKEAVY